MLSLCRAVQETGFAFKNRHGAWVNARASTPGGKGQGPSMFETALRGCLQSFGCTEVQIAIVMAKPPQEKGRGGGRGKGNGNGKGKGKGSSWQTGWGSSDSWW